MYPFLLVHGTVINRSSKERIPFASISWKQTKKGGLTDSSGRFNLASPKGLLGGQYINLMNRFEYFSDRYAGLSIEHNFDKKLLNLLPFMRKVSVRQFWNVKAVCGDLSAENKKLNCREYSNYRLTSLQARPYIEVGTGLDNIFRFFRADLVWRLKNSAYMSTGPQQPPVAKFGIFGSFHVQF